MILYVPRDLVASHQWMSQRPGRLLTYQSGGAAMELMLDGLLGLARKPTTPLRKKTLLKLASLLPGVRLCDVAAASDAVRLSMVERALVLCVKAVGISNSKLMSAKGPEDVHHLVRLIQHHKGAEAAIGLLYNAQNVGAELARDAALPAFGMFDFVSPPALHYAQTTLFSLLEKWLGSACRGGTTEWRRDLHEVVVSFTEPFAGRGPLGYSEKVLVSFAEAAHQLERGSSKGLQACRDIVLTEATLEETYLTADLALKIKTPKASAALATGVLRGTVSQHWRSCAAVAWPEEQPSFLLGERMANNVGELGATLQAIHGIEGLSGKAIIEKAGEMRNNAAALLADLRRDALGVVRGPLTGARDGERCALFTPRAIPGSLWVAPAAILDNKPPIRPTSPGCPWAAVSQRPHFVLEEEEERHLKNKSRHDVARWLDSDGRGAWGLTEEQEQSQRNLQATTLHEEACRRRYSGMKLPVLSMALINGMRPAARPWKLPSPLCSSCKRGARKFQLGATWARSVCSTCQDCTEHPRGAVLISVDIPESSCSWVPSCVEHRKDDYPSCCADTLWKREVRRPCVKGGGWSVHVCSSCGTERESEKRVQPELYPEPAMRRHERAAKSAFPEARAAEVPFLRIELSTTQLLLAGFTDLEEFELLRVLDAAAPASTHAVVEWGQSVVVLSVFGPCLLEHAAELRQLVLGHEGFVLAEGGIKEGASRALRVTLHCTGAPGALGRMRTLLRTAPPGTRGTVVGDYPASLVLEGPEGTLRRMVDDHVGGDASMAATARVLAARRTWSGEVLSCKARSGGMWRLLGLSPAEAFRKLADNAYDGEEQSMEGATRWLGRLEEVGVASVLLMEDPDTPTQAGLRAEQLNRSPLPIGLVPGPPRRTSKMLTFEERSKCLGVRILQLLVQGGQQGGESPAERAERELSERSLPFSVLRRWGGSASDSELVHMSHLN
jgi:hypothetical protein